MRGCRTGYQPTDLYIHLVQLLTLYKIAGTFNAEPQGFSKAGHPSRRIFLCPCCLCVIDPLALVNGYQLFVTPLCTTQCTISPQLVTAICNRSLRSPGKKHFHAIVGNTTMRPVPTEPSALSSQASERHAGSQALEMHRQRRALMRNTQPMAAAPTASTTSISLPLSSLPT